MLDWLPWIGRWLIGRRIGYFLTEMIDDADNHRGDRHRAERERWLAGGVRRRRMYNEALRRFHAQGWGAGLEQPQADETAGSWHWRGLVGVLAAASVLLGLIGWHVIRHPQMADPSSSGEVADRDFRTLPGQMQSIKLADGSVVTLEADTDLVAALTSDLRRIDLKKGAASFRVAHDARRPFVVWAAGGVTTATGTVFSVRLQPDRTIRVDLTAGSVTVASPAVNGKGTNPVRRLTAGQHVVYRAVSTAAPKDRQARAEGNKIHFEYEHLDAVVARLSPHSPVAITLADPSLGALRVYGDCDLHDVAGFVRMIALSLNLDAVDRPGGILLQAKGATSEK